VPLAIAEKLIGIALALDTQDPVLALGSAFDTAFSFQPLHLANPSRRILLIGPAGQGKTVTAARLAARAVLSKRPVQVIAADTARAGAFAQINELCRPMGLIPQIWSSAILYKVGDDFSIIDGPGINPFNAAERTEVENLIAATDAEPILVIAAGGEPEEAAQIGEAFFALGVRRFIATQIDATRRLGGMLAIAAAGLALADAGIGRTLVDTLAPMNPLALARLLVAARAGTNTFDSLNREEAA
jgi:flagellar biosynthesis protein FlhF